MRTLYSFMILAIAGCTGLPDKGKALVDHARGELVIQAVVQHPKDKPCIDNWGQRVQAFVGCKLAAGGDARFSGFFVFLSDVSTEQVHDGLLQLGAKPLVNYSVKEGLARSGLKPTTKTEDYLQGDPVALSVSWKDGDGKWKRRPYQFFAEEKVTVGGKDVIKPWTPHFVFHGSGAVHASGTGCIACPCDCAGGIIADNRNPVFEPKPVVRFDLKKAPPVGTTVYITIRPSLSK